MTVHRVFHVSAIPRGATPLVPWVVIDDARGAMPSINESFVRTHGRARRSLYGRACAPPQRGSWVMRDAMVLINNPMGLAVSRLGLARLTVGAVLACAQYTQARRAMATSPW